MSAALRTDWLKIDNVVPAEHLSDSCKVLIPSLHNAKYKAFKLIMGFRAFMLKTSYVILTGTEKVKDSSLPGSYAVMTCKLRHYCPRKHWGLSITLLSN